MFKPATRSGARLRALLYGPSGSGKTYTGLRLAKGIGGKVAVIDSERGRASKYAGTGEGQFQFDVCELSRYSIADYKKALKEAEGYDVVFIDSISHAWQALLDEVDQKAAASRSNNKFNIWAVATPMQRDFMDTILSHPAHIIGTCRASTEWSQEKDERTGKNKPVKVGLKPQQGKDIEYEFDVLASLDPDHFMQVEKDNSRLYQDQRIHLPSEEIGAAWAAWLSDAPPPEKYGNKFVDELDAALTACDFNGQAANATTQIMGMVRAKYQMTLDTITPDVGLKIISAVNAGSFDKFKTAPEKEAT